MKTITLLLSALLCTAYAGLPTPEEEIATLKAEYARREAAATRPVKDWLALELGKKEKAFLAAGKSEAAAAVAKERAAMLLCSATWTWETDNEKAKVSFKNDGTGIHLASGNLFKWAIIDGKVTLTKAVDGRKAVLAFNASTLTYTGNDYGGHKLAGKAITD